MFRKYGPRILKIRRINSIQTYDSVSGTKPAPIIHGSRRNAVHNEWQGNVKHTRGIEHIPHPAPVQVKVQCVPVPEKLYLAHVVPDHIHLKHTEILDRFSVQSNYVVSGAEAHIISQLIHIDIATLVAQIRASPACQYSYIYKDGENEIEQYPAQHHEQSLPRRFAAHFPGLRFGFQGFSVHRLVHHSRNFAITTERKPSYAIFSVGILGLETEKGLAPHIKEKIELFYPYFENFCKCEMPQLVKKYENGEGQYHLQGFD